MTNWGSQKSRDAKNLRRIVAHKTTELLETSRDYKSKTPKQKDEFKFTRRKSEEKEKLNHLSNINFYKANNE